MKNHRVLLWVLLLLPLLVCFESSAYAQDPPRVRPSGIPTCTVVIFVKDNKQEYSTRPTLYREDGTPTLKVPRLVDGLRYQFGFLEVGNYIVKVRGKYPVAPEQRNVYCRAGRELHLFFKVTGT